MANNNNNNIPNVSVTTHASGGGGTYINNTSTGGGGGTYINNTSTGGGGGTYINNTSTAGNYTINTQNAWAGVPNSAKLTLTGNDADIVINGRSLMKSIDAIQERLKILEPKPELLEKYQALQAAYEHYKLLEALLYDDGNNKSK
jgi:hypothetical protein